MKVHVTRDGKAIPLTKLSDRHLMNIIRRHRRLAREGVLVCWGVMTGPWLKTWMPIWTGCTGLPH